MYLLLLGTTALSLVRFNQREVHPFFHSFLWFNHKIDVLQVTTPLLFKLIPAVMNLGVLMHWFPSENGSQNEVYLVLSHIPPSIYLHHFYLDFHSLDSQEKVMHDISYHSHICWLPKNHRLYNNITPLLLFNRGKL